MWTSTRGEGGPTHVDACGPDPCGQGEGGSKRDFFVDVINGWPLSSTWQAKMPKAPKQNGVAMDLRENLDPARPQSN